MKNADSEKIVEPYKGRRMYHAPKLIGLWHKNQGYIPSEGDLRLMGIRNYEKHPEILESYWDSSTLYAAEGDKIKVILPYDNSGDKELTYTAEKSFADYIDIKRLSYPGLILSGSNINLIDFLGNSEFGLLEGREVYTLKKSDLLLNEGLTEKQAMENSLLLTKLGHPNHVNSEFARPIEEVEEIISGTFKLGKDLYGRDKMMEQLVSDWNSVLNTWCVNGIGAGASSNANTDIDGDYGRFAFVKF
ncbi:MAG: hypothetical protein KC516_04030 [Nanoarchaeota archaeon]|nr:hypothetical protein [Nanoarchaeota archaeon]